MSEVKRREFWIQALDIPAPGSFKVTGALASGDNPQDGEVHVIELAPSEIVISRDQLREAWANSLGDAIQCSWLENELFGEAKHD